MLNDIVKSEKVKVDSLWKNRVTGQEEVICRSIFQSLDESEVWKGDKIMVIKK